MTVKKFFATLLLIAGLVTIFVTAKRLIFDRQPQALASLRVDSFPPAKVFFNDRDIGQTSVLLEDQPPGEYNLKVVPVGRVTTTPITWESKVRLTSGTLTYVSRNLGATSELSGGQVLTLEKLPLARNHEVAVVSTPDNASVSVDGQKEGQTSIVLKNLSTGDHEIVVSSSGFSDQVVQGRVVEGFRLNVVVTLAKLPEGFGGLATSSAQSTATLVATGSGEVAKPYVVIKETETGFLRVRSDPTLSASETARVKPGEKYPLLSETAGWVKIKLSNLFGWVNDAYVEKVK